MRYNSLQLLIYASLAASSLVTPLYARDLGATTAFIGFIAAGYGTASFLGNFLFGRAGDRFDRRFVLLLGFTASTVFLAFHAAVSGPRELLIVRFMSGFFMGAIPPTLAAYVHDIKRPLGKFTSYNAMGWLVASLLVVGVGYLATHVFTRPGLEAARQAFEAWGDFRTLFVLSAAFCFLGLLFAVGVPPMRLGLPVALFPREILRRNRHVYLSLFVRHFGAAAIWVIYPLYILELGGDLSLIGWIYVVNMVAQVILYRNVERFQRLASARTLIVIGLALSAATFFAFTLAHNAYQLLPLQAPLGVSFACLWLGSMKEVLEHNTERATATGLLNASMNLSNVVGPLAGGLIADRFGFRATMYFGAVLTLLALGLFYLLARAPPVELAMPEQVTGPSSDVAP